MSLLDDDKSLFRTNTTPQIHFHSNSCILLHDANFYLPHRLTATTQTSKPPLKIKKLQPLLLNQPPQKQPAKPKLQVTISSSLTHHSHHPCLFFILFLSFILLLLRRKSSGRSWEEAATSLFCIPLIIFKVYHAALMVLILLFLPLSSRRPHTVG